MSLILNVVDSHLSSEREPKPSSMVSNLPTNVVIKFFY